MWNCENQGLMCDGTGTSKKEAKKAAATQFLEALAEIASGKASVPSVTPGAPRSSATWPSNMPEQGGSQPLTVETAPQWQQADDKVGRCTAVINPHSLLSWPPPLDL